MKRLGVPSSFHSQYFSFHHHHVSRILFEVFARISWWYLFTPMFCRLQIAFHDLNPFPMRVINNKRQYYMGQVKVRYRRRNFHPSSFVSELFRDVWFWENSMAYVFVNIPCVWIWEYSMTYGFRNIPWRMVLGIFHDVLLGNIPWCIAWVYSMTYGLVEYSMTYGFGNIP